MTDEEHSSSVSSPTTVATTPEMQHQDQEDVWASDDDYDPTSTCSQSQNNGEILSDLPTIKRQHMTDGYREGLSIGKSKVMQKGFDEGYPVGMAIALRAGKVLGTIEGIVASKDASDTSRPSFEKLLEQAKRELAISTLLQDLNDLIILEATEMPAMVEQKLRKWELTVFGADSSSEAS